jgi:hypothetical protein
MQTTITDQYEITLHGQILKLCHSTQLSLHDNVLGSKVYTNYQRVALIVLFMRSQKALRKFTAELVESKWPQWLGLKELVTKSTLNRWIRKFDLAKLRELLTQTIADEKPSLMAIDATGFDSFNRNRHYEMRLKQFGINNAKMPFAKADLLIDTENKLVYDFVLRTKPRHDTLGAKTMVKRLKHSVVLILADKGYDSEPLHEIVVATGNLMYAPARDFSVKRPKGRHRRRCVHGHKQYFQRNIAESINFSLKSRFRSLQSKLHWMKKREFAWQLITYNLERLSKATKALLYWLVGKSFGTKPIFDYFYKVSVFFE